MVAKATLPPSILVYNTTANVTVVSTNADVIRPMASITKLMTAMVSLDLYKLNQPVRIGKNSTLTVEQLLTNLLVRSDNTAAEILAQNHSSGRVAFLQAMNDKAKLLGLINTEYHDASGLIATNLTTAHELVTVVSHAGTYPFIKQTSTLTDIPRTLIVKKKPHIISLANTNKTILFEFDNVTLSKTGFTTKAGRCVVMLVDNKGEQYAIIILGEPTKQARDQVAKNLIQTSLTK